MTHPDHYASQRSTVMNNQKTIQRAAARLAYLGSLPMDSEIVNRVRIGKGDPLVKRMISRMGK